MKTKKIRQSAQVLSCRCAKQLSYHVQNIQMFNETDHNKTKKISKLFYFTFYLTLRFDIISIRDT